MIRDDGRAAAPAYSQGVHSSRRIACGCEERLDFQAVTALNRPDFRTISEFRRRHLTTLSELFVQVLALCQCLDLVGLGQVAVDGTGLRGQRSRYRLRKPIVEPVFGQIKAARGSRQLLPLDGFSRAASRKSAANGRSSAPLIASSSSVRKAVARKPKPDPPCKNRPAVIKTRSRVQVSKDLAFGG